MLLLSKLSDVLDISVTEIARRCNINQPVLYHNIKGDVEMTVQSLIRICNGLRIPSHFFISENDNHIIPTRETATIEADRWKNISWNSKVVEKTFGDGDGKIYWKDVASVMKVTAQKPHERFLLRTRFPINSFLNTCNHYSISPFLFLSDQNKPAEKANKQIKVKTTAKRSVPPSYVALAKRVDLLECSVTDLQQKYAALLKLMDDHISKNSANDIGMAAESNPISKQ